MSAFFSSFSADEISSITFVLLTVQIRQFMGGQLLAMFLRQLLNVIHLQSRGLPQEHNFIDSLLLLFVSKTL